MATKEPTLGELIDRLDKLRKEYRAIEEKAKPIKEQYSELETAIQKRLLEEGTEKATGRLATVSLKRSLVASVKDWDLLTAYVKKTGNFQLFSRSIPATSFRELYERELAKVKPGKTPEITAARVKEVEVKFTQTTGLTPFMKISLNHDSLKNVA